MAETIKLLGMEIKKKMAGSISSPFADISYLVRKMHDACGDSAIIYVDDDKAVLAVLDGVSGEPGAEQASSVAAIAILNHLKGIDSPSKDDLQEAMVQGHTHITNGFTTALVVVMEKNGRFFSASVGDSVLYSIDKGSRVKQEFLQKRIVGEGSSIFRYMAFRNVVGSVLGAPGDMEIFFKQGKVEPGEFLLLVTDGVTDNLKFDVDEGMVKDCSGERDLKEIIGEKKDEKAIVKAIEEEVLARMENKVQINEAKESLIIKPDDLAIICIGFNESKDGYDRMQPAKKPIRKKNKR